MVCTGRLGGRAGTVLVGEAVDLFGIRSEFSVVAVCAVTGVLLFLICMNHKLKKIS